MWQALWDITIPKCVSALNCEFCVFVHPNSIDNRVDISSHEEKINKLNTYVVDKQTKKREY